MAIDLKLIDKLLADYKKPEDIIWENGPLKQSGQSSTGAGHASRDDRTPRLLRSTTRPGTTAATRVMAGQPRR
jgi:hypothetical protein